MPDMKPISFSIFYYQSHFCH